MLGLTFVSLISLLPYVLATKYVVHEKRASLPMQWSHQAPVSAEQANANMLPMRVGLTQNNMDRIEQMLMKVSHPESPNYSDHLSHTEIIDAFAPNDDTIERVRNWIESAGIPADSIKLSLNKGWLEFTPTVSQAEELLQTKYHTYEHAAGLKQVACEHYSVPEHLQNDIDLIMPTLHFDAQPEHHAKFHETIKRQQIRHQKLNKRYMSQGPAMPRPQITFVEPPNNPTTNLSLCDSQISPACLQALYKVDACKVPKVKGNTFAMVEYSPNYMNYADLDQFFGAYVPNARNYAPTFLPTDGAVNNQSAPSTSSNLTIFYDAYFGKFGEGNLDFQFGAALAYPAIPRTQYFQVGAYNLTDFTTSFNNFLDAIDGSYCTSGGGNDPNFDDPEPAGNCGQYNAPKVISTSYGYNELDLTPRYEARQCAEYAKLGMHGVSFFFSSGDNGVAGNGGQCIDPAAGTGYNGNYTEYNDGTSGLFNPSFPPTCPYVTAVGATNIKAGGTVKDREIVADSYIISGGGVSNVFKVPSYQKSAVRNYFKHMPKITGLTGKYLPYNKNPTAMRSYPDISANGLNLTVAAAGRYILVGGTSASSPIAASIFSLVNAERLACGKKPIGFVNPVLYANPSALNDIVSGSNPGCSTSGFFATKGWDPATGLGTPNFPKLMKVFNKLR